MMIEHVEVAAILLKISRQVPIVFWFCTPHMMSFLYEYELLTIHAVQKDLSYCIYFSSSSVDNFLLFLIQALQLH